MFYMQRPRIWISVVSVLLIVGTTACNARGGASPSGVSNPAERTDTEYLVAGVDPASLCFGASALPSDFTPDGASALSIADLTSMVSNAPNAAQTLATSGHVATAYRQWSLSGGDQSSKQESSATQQAIEQQSHDAAVKRTYISTLCQLSLFDNTQGAHQTVALLRDGFAQPGPGEKSLPSPDPRLGTESTASFVEGPNGGFGTEAIIFRIGNVVGVVTVTTICEESDCSSKRQPAIQEATHLANLVLANISSRLVPGHNPNASPVPPASTPDTSP